MQHKSIRVGVARKRFHESPLNRTPRGACASGRAGGRARGVKFRGAVFRSFSRAPGQFAEVQSRSPRARAFARSLFAARSRCLMGLPDYIPRASYTLNGTLLGNTRSVPTLYIRPCIYRYIPLRILSTRARATLRRRGRKGEGSDAGGRGNRCKVRQRDCRTARCSLGYHRRGVVSRCCAPCALLLSLSSPPFPPPLSLILFPQGSEQFIVESEERAARGTAKESTWILRGADEPEYGIT